MVENRCFLCKDSKKGQMNMSFGWIFALVAGGIILFLTIYGVTQFMGTAQQQQTSAEAEELEVLLNPLQTSFSSAISTYIERDVSTRINNDCSLNGDFGEQIIGISEESIDGWTDAGLESNSENKYIFSNSTVQGERFYIFSKPFNFPYKVGDLIYLTSEDKRYCFDSPPEDVENELKDLNQQNLIVGCSGSSEDSVKVCFSGSSECEVNVDYDEDSYSEPSGSVEKGGEKMYFYTDALMYGAIFSDKGTYECQLGRLMKRASNLASIYSEKHSYMERTACQTDFRNDLGFLSSLSVQDGDVSGLLNSGNVLQNVEDLENRNDGAACSLW